MAIITYPLNGIEYGASDVETYLCTRTSGVYAQDGMFAATAIGGRQVQIAPGLAWIKNATYKGKSICVDAPVIVDIAIADTTFARIDRIVLRFDATANASSIIVKSGNAISNPAAPEVTRTESLYELALCDVSVPAGSVTVEPQHLSSKLLDESVCGIMRDAVTGIPTQDLYDAFSAWQTAFKQTAEDWQDEQQDDFAEWRDTQETTFEGWQADEKQAYQVWLDGIEQILNENVAGNLLNMIEATNAVVATKAATTYVDTALAAKANTTYVDNQLSTKAPLTHTHAASDVTAGALGGQVQANSTAVGALASRQLRNMVIAASAPTDAVNGDIWLSYTQ